MDENESRGNLMPISICVLTYGHYCSLARRCIESILTNCDPDTYELIVGANEVGDETEDYLRNLKEGGGISKLYFSEVNINKSPMMRRMFSEIQTDLIWWFDDDSYITDGRALSNWLEIACRSPLEIVMWGHVFFFGSVGDFNYGTDVEGYVKRASWYCGKTPPSWECGGKDEYNFENNGIGDGRWFFATGGCWMIRTSAILALNWPDLTLVKRNDDVILAEAIRQQGWLVKDVGPLGVAINQAERRGSGEDSQTMIRQIVGD